MVETNEGASKGTNSKNWLIIGIILLVLIFAVFLFLNIYKSGLKEGTVVIKAGDNTLGSFTIADLKKLPAVEKKMVVYAVCGSDSKHDFVGTALIDVLNSIDPDLTQKYKKVITRGIDHYSQVLEMSEVQQPDNVYIVYADFGKPLKTKTGSDGSLQVIICKDKSAQRYTNWLVSLELQ